MFFTRHKAWVSLIVGAIGIGVGFQLAQVMATPAPAKQRIHWAYEFLRAQAHARMENTMYASTPDHAGATVMCPALSDGKLGPPIAVDVRGTYLKADSRKFSAKDEGSEPETDSALDFFLNNISGPIVQAKCVNCHVEGGVSGHTRLVLYSSSNPDHGALNLAVFENFLADVEDGGDLILNKIQGVGHGGGVQVAAGSDDFTNMERFLGLLGHGDDTGPGLSPETLFDTVTMASPGKTLRRAALIFGGEIPTREEREAVDKGTEEDLRNAIRNLMTGRGFHEFLIRSANDRLLTDRKLGEYANIIDEANDNWVGIPNKNWELKEEALAEGLQAHEYPPWNQWMYRLQYGAGRAPLELIAHVVENDLPYTEILTADYIMANSVAAEGYGASTRFDDPSNPNEFKPSRIVSYYRDDESKITEARINFATRVIDPGNLSTDYPHAGILNTTSFLRRYPTTPTNRNRARSRWTYYHFLGLDIEKSAARTTDPVALADTDNPTMKNPACTVCHRVMDPVAGAFQNYGEQGDYRDEWGGLDSLDNFYKNPPDGSHTPYQYGDSWYRDMREPGFDGEVAPNAENSLQWLAERIVADDRFAEGTVKFWWPAILGIEVATPPEDRNDSDFEAMLLASNAQSAEVERLAEAFRTGTTGGTPYNLKDLLVEIVLSPWFRAESIEDDDPARLAALQTAGVERLLTPEELAWKTQAITGYAWGRHLTRRSEDISYLTDKRQYQLLYGGIDSDAVTERTDDVTALMAAVAQNHATQVSCPIVRREFLLWPDEKRRLFGGIDEHVTPVSDKTVSFEITVEDWKAPQTVSFQVALNPGSRTIRLSFTNDYWGGEGDDRDLYLDRMEVRSSNGKIVKEVEFESIRREQDCGTYWLSHNSYKFWSNCSLEIPVEIPVSDDYTIEVGTFQDRGGDDPAMLVVSVESDIDTSQGAMAIRNKLVELHEKLLGVTVTSDSPEVDAVFRLFVEVWDRERSATDSGRPNWWRAGCWIQDQHYFEGIADDLLFYNEYGDLDYDWDRVDEILEEVDFHRLRPVVRAWVTVLAYFLMDYRYLFF